MPQSTRLPSLALAVLAGCALLTSGCAPGRALEAKRLLLDVAAGEGPSDLKAATGTPTRETIELEVAGRRYAADRYTPAEPADAALVLVPGAAPAGKDDRRLVAFATSLARVRFEVLVPDIENLRALKVTPADATAIADAVRHHAASDGSADGPESDRPVGVIAISYAAGPAVIAAVGDDIRHRVAFLYLVGGYYDITAATAYFTTGYYRASPAEAWREGRPDPTAKWIFLDANAERIQDPADQQRLEAIAVRKQRRLDADIAELKAQLGPEGQSVLALLENRDPARVPDLIAGLPTGLRDDIMGLDVKSQDLSRLKARLILVHGRDDPVIPWSESAALAAAVPERQARLFMPDNLAHVDLGPGSIADALSLWEAAYRLLEERDAMAAGS